MVLRIVEPRDVSQLARLVDLVLPETVVVEYLVPCFYASASAFFALCLPSHAQLLLALALSFSLSLTRSLSVMAKEPPSRADAYAGGALSDTPNFATQPRLLMHWCCLGRRDPSIMSCLAGLRSSCIVS